MKKKTRFPIHDLQWHKDQLREIDADHDDLEAQTLVHWHLIAIGFLEYGTIKGYDGPAAEAKIDLPTGETRIVSRKIASHLWLTTGPDGHPLFEPDFHIED